MQRQEQQQRLTTPLRAPRGGGDGSYVQMFLEKTPETFGVLLKDSQSLSPAPCFPSDAVSLFASQQRQGDHQHTGAPPSDCRPPSLQPRELFHAPQRRHQQKQQQHASPSCGAYDQQGDGGRCGSGSGSGASNEWRERTVSSNPRASRVGGNTRPRKPLPPGNSPDEDRRRRQREKQIQFGYVTDGYTNMKRLIAHDPLLRSGGILPLSPPEIVNGSKRQWDIQLRKWRRALHMFDYVFIDGEDDPTTRAKVLEEQRQQWVSEALNEMPREARLKIDLDTLRLVQHSATVPCRIPIEEDLRCILRNDGCYESLRSVVPQSASSLTKGTDISPIEAGIKIHIAPSAAVVQRQQAHLEMQQRLSSLHQQALATEVAVGGKETTSHVASAPPVLAATAQCADAQRPTELSPSPRRPPLPLRPTPHQQHCDNPRNKQNCSTLSGSPLSHATAAPTFTSLGNAETAPGLSASQPRALSLSGSSATGWGASPGAPRGSSTVAVLEPPLSFSGSPPSVAPHTRMHGVAAPPQASAAGVTMPTMAPPILPWCTHCGHRVDLPAPGIASAPYGGMGTGTAVAADRVPAPTQMRPQHASRAVIGGTCEAMMSPLMQLPSAMTCMNYPTASTAATAATSPLHWSMLARPMVEGVGGNETPATHHGCSYTQYCQFEAWQDAFTAMPRSAAAAVVGRSCLQNGHCRSSGAVATGGRSATQAVPRFVARLSALPNEQRLGEQQPAERPYSPDGVNDGVLVATNPLATDTSASVATPATLQQSPSACDAAVATAQLEKSQSVLAVTPERTLFGAGIMKEAPPVVGGAQRPHETQQDTPLGKPMPMPEVEEALGISFVFDTDE
nr:unnamed protein product [Leishmania braziliensis]